MGGVESGNGLRRLTQLEDRFDKLTERVTTNEKALAAVPYIENAVTRIDENCAKTREYVDAQLEAKEQEDREEKRLSRGQRLTITGLVIALLGVLVAAISTLSTAGVFN